MVKNDFLTHVAERMDIRVKINVTVLVCFLTLRYNTDQNQLGEEKHNLASTSSSQSVFKGSQDRKSRQESGCPK